MKRGCWIALWAVGAYIAARIGVWCAAELSHKLLANVRIPADVIQHILLMEEFARGLFPYIAGSVVFCLGLGAHLPGTRVTVRESVNSEVGNC